MILQAFTFFFISSLLCIFYHKFAQKNGIVDKPNKYNMHKKKVPKSVGFVICVVFLLFLITLNFQNSILYNNFLNTFNIIRIWPLYIAIFFSAFFFFIDDLKDLDPTLKLLFQMILGFCIVSTISYPILGLPIKLEYLASVLIVIFFANTFNFIDGFDGMFSITILYILIAINSLIFNSSELSFIFNVNLVFLACMLPYMILNKSEKMKIFLGDSGAVTTGIFLSWEFLIILKTQYKIEIILIFLYPVLDVSITILKKIIKGRHLFSKDFDYFFLKPVKNFKKTHQQNFNNFLLFYLINYIIIFLLNIEEILVLKIILIFLINLTMIYRLNKGLSFVPKIWK